MRRLGWWLVVAVLADSCTTSNANEGTPSDQTDVWFMQHMVPHLLQTAAIVDLAEDRITRPKLDRLAGTVDQQGQAHLQQLQAWLASRGLAPYDPQQDPDRGKETDLERLSRVHGTRFDLAFLEVMTARHRTGLRMAGFELRDGGVPGPRTTPVRAQVDSASALASVQWWLGAGSDGEAARAFLDEAGRFPVLIQHLNPLGVDPTDHGPDGDADGMGWANWGGPVCSEHRAGPVDQGGDLLELLGTDLVAHWLPPVGTAGASSQMRRMSIRFRWVGPAPAPPSRS